MQTTKNTDRRQKDTVLSPDEILAIQKATTGEDMNEVPDNPGQTFIIYTDGGYHIPKDEGAYAFVILQDDRIIHREATVIRGETNNRGELKAIIEAVRWCPAKSALFVNSDSQYALFTLKGDWGRKKNKDLFAEWDRLLAEKQPVITFNWVRGHSGNVYNELCDRMCDEAVGYDLNGWIPKKKKRK